ncbi:MAG: hypothetical protein JNM86_00250 [Phycisphaerae bacterium]|nr:hypothetical protein [Phycisphaerae bacterium]
MFNIVKNRPTALLAAALTSIASIAPSAVADNQVPFSDVDFALADWSLTNYGNTDATATQNVNGFSGTCRRVVHPLSGSASIRAFHKYLPASATLDPANGGVVSIDFSIKAKFINGVGIVGHSIGLALEQGGIAYYAAGLTTGVSGNWVTRSANYTASSFVRFDGQPGTPDLSTSGAPISFGFVTINNGGSNINQIVHYDDLVITAHRNTLVMGDTEFALTDWSVTPFTTGSGGTPTAIQLTTGGNPIPCRRVTHAMNAGTTTLRVFHKYLPASGTILPSQGAIDRIEMSLDARFVSGVGSTGHSIGIALEQGGIAYFSSGQTTGTGNTWVTRQSAWLAAADFTRFDGLVGTPDFSTAGAPIQLGYRTATSNSGGGAFSQVVNYDNWSVRVHFVPCTSDLTSDGAVDDTDFVLFATAYDILDCADPSMPSGCPADVNGDGFVDDTDFVQFSQAYDALECP